MMRERITVPMIRSSKLRSGHEPIAMITAYDYPSAKMVDRAGADMVLVGDSLAMVVLGHHDTLNVTIDEMVYHTKAVAMSDPRALIVTDMPWMSYHTTTSKAVMNAAKLIRAGASAVKIEGGTKRHKVIVAISEAEIPVVGHLGLTPQSIKSIGGFKVQAKTQEQVDQLIEDAISIQNAGAFAIVLEAIPESVAARVTELLEIPTIGIGAGIGCDGQVLVFHDILGYGGSNSYKPKFVKSYADLETLGTEALGQFVKEVKTKQFPTIAHSYRNTVADPLNLL